MPDKPAIVPTADRPPPAAPSADVGEPATPPAPGTRRLGPRRRRAAPGAAGVRPVTCHGPPAAGAVIAAPPPGARADTAKARVSAAAVRGRDLRPF